MNNILVFCQTDRYGLMDVSLELLTKGRELASESGADLDAVLIGDNVSRLADNVKKYGVCNVYVAEDSRLADYTTLPYCSIVKQIAEATLPSVLLFGATRLGRDLAPRVAAELQTGITADCTKLEIGDYTDNGGILHKKILRAIRPSFVGNQLTTIIEPFTRPQMVTVREGVMTNKPLNSVADCNVIYVDISNVMSNLDNYRVTVIGRDSYIRPNGLKNAGIVVAGGYGVGSLETFKRLGVLAEMLGGEVGATRAAVDAGFVQSDRMIGQTGLTVAPKLYIAFGISGQVQHTVGMDRSSVILAVNTDPDAPIHRIADYSIIGKTSDVVEKMIASLKKERE